MNTRIFSAVSLTKSVIFIKFCNAGVEVSAARNLPLLWAEAFFAIEALAYGRRLKPKLSLECIVPAVTLIIEAIAGALHANEDEREMGRALSCMDLIHVRLFGDVLDLLDDSNASKAFAQSPATPAAVDALTEAVSTLQKLTAESQVPIEHSLFASRLNLCACSAVAAALCLASGPTLFEKIDVICGPHVVRCMQEASGAWADLVHRVKNSHKYFNFYTCMSGPATGLFYLFLHSISSLLPQFDDTINRSMLQLDPAARALAAQGARAVAVAAATFPAALSLVQEGARVAGPKAYALDVALMSTLKASLCVYTTAITSTSHASNGTIQGSLDSINDMALTAHACISAALALKNGEGCLVGPQLSAADLQIYVSSWMNAGKLILEILSEGGRKDAATPVVLRLLAALAELSQPQLQNFDTDGALADFAAVICVKFEELCAVIVPEDVEGLERVQCHSGPNTEAAAKLGSLIQIATGADGLELRQSNRLEMGRLPDGVCCNLRCSEVPPAGDLLKRCAGCSIARFCSQKCFTYAWQHGHKAPCLMMQHEHGSS